MSIMNKISLLFTLSFIIYIPVTLQQCVITQNCYNGNSRNCSIPEAKNYTPSVLNNTLPYPIQCPEFEGQPVCCNADQNMLLSVNFFLIDFTFGTINSGCDVCAANLKRMWCYFTCSPKQGEFLKPGGLINITNDPIYGNVTVRGVDFWLDQEMTCQMQQSCAQTPYVYQIDALQTPVGFMNFLGSNAVKQGKEKITIKYTSNENGTHPGLKLVPNNCSYMAINGTDQYGFKITKNATCSVCSDLCSDNKNNIENLIIPHSVFEGFNLLAVLIVVGFIIIETIFCLVIRKVRSKNNKQSDINGSEAKYHAIRSD